MAAWRAVIPARVVVHRARADIGMAMRGPAIVPVNVSINRAPAVVIVSYVALVTTGLGARREDSERGEGNGCK